MHPAISVQNISKRFNRGERFDSFRDLLGGRWLKMRGQINCADVFFAVHDISFQVQRGESFGIIGPNGAGKSTLLKLLARIMPPDEGTIDVRGRVSALIELGAGFHPDLTGRENIFLNASILGMPRKEVRRKFGEIVEFAGIGDFLDTPVKRYSSGMYARLGFAIAVHVEPNILLVDEVLSVGDRVFRARCMDKMREFLRQGVAIVFVSHDLASVQRFCDRAMVIARGQESFTGSGTQAVAHYWAASTPATPKEELAK
jgi:ABC-type polysaccharide/polyol phosphate transport system ATPase subunit